MSDETNYSPRDVPLRDLSKDKSSSLVAFPRARPPDNNLPLELSSFIGREKEVAEVERLLGGGTTRLVTLCGPGGCGKTRLALAVARDLVEGSESDVWWVELASLSDPKLVPGAVASALGVREAPDRPLIEALIEHLRSRKTLLVLDNCEHLVEGCAALADTLLRACPELEILATSREPLRVAGESSWVVPSLSLPDPRLLPPTEELMRYEAVRLFVERAKAVDAGYALTDRNASAVARLCYKLDGIPLAIELAAARVRVLTAEQISEKLKDSLGLLTTGDRTGAARHQTLRATLQWSYELLSEAEQALFRRLSVFAGGWTLEAAETVGAGGGIEEGEVLDLLGRLVDKSLVVAETGEEGTLRYRMLEPIRQYALERLVESGEAEETRRRHTAFFVTLAEEAYPELRAEPQVEWLERLEKENANLRGALSWALSAEDIPTAARLGWALWPFWWIHNHQPEGRGWMERVLLGRDALPPPLRIRATIATAAMAFGQGDAESSLWYAAELMELSRAVGGDALAQAYAHAGFGLLATTRDELEAASEHLEKALPLFREAGEYGMAAQTPTWLGTILLLQGDHEGARRRFEEGLAQGRRLGERVSMHNALFNLAQLALAEGDYEAAFRWFAGAIAPSEELGDRGSIAWILEGLGVVAGARGEAERATRLLGASEALISAIGLRGHPEYHLDRALYERIEARVRSTLGEAAFEAAFSEGRAMSPERAIEYALEQPMRDEAAREEVVSSVLRPAGRPKEETGGHRRHNLPAARSSFVGRQSEMAEIKRALSTTRLLTITGAGGCGKTRLTLEVARDLIAAPPGAYADGVWLVELASLSEGDLVPNAVAAVLGVREHPDLAPTDALTDFLRSKRMLLVLDNCEHLIEACADLVDALLGSCESLSVLATSREALRIAGETNWMAPSLTVPDAGQPLDPERLTRYEAVQLFLERARSRLQGLALTAGNAAAVVDICRKLDGIPLAIELATARMGALSVEQISERLGNSLGFLTTGERTKAPRHQTLRAALTWSGDLLSGPERKLFGRLSVFAGGWTLAAAETVGEGGSMEAREVLDLLSSLVNKSLVVVEDSPSDAGGLRYRMLEPVRQYAMELLEEGGEVEEIRRLHAAFFVALAEEAYPKLRAAPQVEWLGRLEKENGNLRATLSWALSAGEIATAARLGFALWPFWWIRNRQPEGRRWMEQVLLERDKLPPPLRIRATIAASTMAYGQGDAESSLLPYAVELMELSRAAGGDALAEAHAHAGFGLLATARGDFDAATEHLEKVLPLYREAGEDGLAAQTHVWLGTVLLLRGDHGGARQRFEEGLALGRGIGDRLSICNALFNLAQLALARGDHDEASRRFAEGIAPSEELGDRGNTAYILEGLGIVAGAQGEAVRAARLLGASEVLFSAIGLRGHTYYQFDRALYERIEARVRSTLGEAAFEAAFSEGRAMSPERAVEYALEQPMAPDEEEEGQPSAAGVVVPREDDRPSAAGTAALRIIALGAARVEKEGRPLDSPDWIQKSRELLFYLLSYPEGRTKEQIGLALWPEASTSQLRSSFHDTVYRLRRALGGKEWIVFEKGRYAFDRSLSYSYDVEDFEEYLSEAQRARSGAPDQAIAHLQQAAALYGGDFLEDFADSEWVMERQEELRRKYQEALLLLGVLLLARERQAEAAEAYRKAIAHDRFLEEAHRGLMRCQAALGERGRAIRHYEELVELLEEQLGTAPAPETRALYERLRAGEEV